MACVLVFWCYKDNLRRVVPKQLFPVKGSIMFAVSDEKKGITCEQLNTGTPHTKRGQSPVERDERSGSRQFSGGPKSQSGKHVTKPDAIQAERKIALGTKTGAHENTLSIVFPAINTVVPDHHAARRIEKILLKFWKQAPPNMRRKISAVVAHLSNVLSGEGRGRTTKRLRQHRDHEKASLLLAGFLHTVEPQVVRRIGGLEYIADIVDYSRPVGLMQCLLHCVIELEKSRDRAGYLVLLDLIQAGSFEFEDRLVLCCFVLDLIDSAERNDHHSAEIVAAKGKASAMLTLTTQTKV